MKSTTSKIIEDYMIRKTNKQKKDLQDKTEELAIDTLKVCLIAMGIILTLLLFTR